MLFSMDNTIRFHTCIIIITTVAVLGLYDSTAPSQHVWSSGILRCGSDGMDLASTLTLGPCSEYLRLQVGSENSSFCGARGPLSALEALRDALYKSTTTAY